MMTFRARSETDFGDWAHGSQNSYNERENDLSNSCLK